MPTDRHPDQQPLVSTQSNSEPPPSSPGRISKVPTGLGAEPLNIVILGASYAGLAVAHAFLDNTINHLRITKAAPTYRLIIISPSTHMYWNIGAPRAIVGPDLIADEDLFVPIEPAFHRHRAHNLSIIQGECVAMDSSARTVTVEAIGSTAAKRASQVNKRRSQMRQSVTSMTQNQEQQVKEPKVQTLAYHALIMATGSSAHSDLLSLHGPHLNTLGALNAFHARVVGAKSIVVCGGGCSGVETAGQLATYLNYSSHWPFRKRVKQPKKVILITGSNRCLSSSSLRPARAKPEVKAEKILRKLGVEVKHDVRVVAAKEGFDLTGQTKIELSDDTSLIADLHIPCTGVSPNTAYASSTLRDKHGYIVTTPTLRVDDACGPRIYAIGDCANYSRNSIEDVYAAVPVLMRNLLNDLLAHEYMLASPYGGNRDRIEELQDVVYKGKQDESLRLLPISRFGGVGVWRGRDVPGRVVHLLKGRDFCASKARRVVGEGVGPYPVKTAPR
ncbi:hypothetical protein LTR37_009204 [Vermiconidia calcicola]|uniref:Uncharacterized protein n=1 Tax=Vermiconidia calcicola TaxID=1690605 RepID=A0ACC3N8H0_9PEZI|nr:hypothetical protein LTR37_009204 [Vermiconidia calcicola]